MTDEQLQSEVFRLRPQLLRQAYSLLREQDEAEDATQDVLLRLWQLRAELIMPIENLARVMMHNQCIDRCRHRQYMDSIECAEEVAASDDVAELERIERMMRTVDSLPGLQQTILRMRHMEGMEMGDIAKVLGTSEANVRKMLSRARLAVKEKMINKQHNGKD